MLKETVAAGPQHHLRMYRTGDCRVKGHYAYRNWARDRDHHYTIYIGVIQGGGVTALVDTGMESVAEMNRRAGFLLSELISQQPGEDTLSILERAEVAPDEVDYVLLTHCHYDHCSNLPLFPRAVVVIPERAWRVWHEDPEARAYLHQGFLEYLAAVQREGRLLLLDEGLVAPGLGVRWVGGHSPCSQFVYVNTSRGVAVLSGDTVQMYGNLEHNDVIGIWVDDAQCWRALEIAREDPDVLVPGHEPRVLDEFPDGIVA